MRRIGEAFSGPPAPPPQLRPWREVWPLIFGVWGIRTAPRRPRPTRSAEIIPFPERRRSVVASARRVATGALLWIECRAVKGVAE